MEEVKGEKEEESREERKSARAQLSRSLLGHHHPIKKRKRTAMKNVGRR